ncbi:MAG: solute carrier family 23 protein [Synoicihabitans sp.]
MLNRIFKLPENDTSVSREIQAGFTTFAAMAYILAVNPSILSATGMDQGALITVTALTAAVSTILMAALTNFPLALAPGMGINAFFTYTIVLSAGIRWQEALGMVFINGVAFLLLSVTGIREKIVKAIPYSLKIAITCGIGLFIAFIGLKNGGVIVDNPATLVGHGDFTTGSALVCLIGVALTIILVARKVPGAIIVGIALTALIGLLVPDGTGGKVTTLPSGVFSLPASPAPVFLELEFGFLKSSTAFLVALPLILTLLMVDMFDNIGTLIGVTKRAGMLDKNGNLPKAGRALVADSIAAILSSLFGTSTVVSYIESASGVEAGGRTGLTAVTVAVLMLFALFLTPLILAVPAAATAPALVVVGIFMLQSVVEIKMEEFQMAAPAMLTILCIPLTFSIAEGIGIGLIAAALLAIATGKAKAFPTTGYVIAGIFFLEFFHIFPFSG